MSSNSMQAAERLVVAGDFVQAVRAGEWDRADHLWPELGGLLSDDCLQAAATLHMHRERWQEAGDALLRIKTADQTRGLHINLCRNLAALRAHRPEIYRTIADADVADVYRVEVTRSGLPTIARTRPDGGRAFLAGGDDPRQAAIAVRDQLAAACERGEALGLLSIGDGYVLDQLARQSPTLFLGRQQAIFLFEPDPRLVLACMLIHDFTGADGPIERPSVLWFVGPRWAEQFRLETMTERFLPFPQITIKLGLDPKPLEQALQAILVEIGQRDIAAASEVAKYYASLPSNHFAQILSISPARAPRVLLITTRFSTVLQYSSRDAADAFRQIGCEAQVLIEPTAHHGLTRNGMRRMLADFKPDLIFQIDHNRFEHADLFPPQIPFVNWIQDLLPHLMTQQTGQRIGSRDFVLTPSLQRWTDDFAYPASQCLEFRKLTRIPSRPISWASRSSPVVYVSNWSQTPQQMRDELLQGMIGKTRDVIDAACARMIALYAAGQSLPTPGDVRRLLVQVLRDLEVAGDEALVRQTTTRLFDRLNNLLFRQQGLAWAAGACRDLDLKLEIYGNGWEKNPEFKSFAAGPVEYGAALEELTRNAMTNLVLEPFVCIAHQRCLDALAAGGFCLQREHPAVGNIKGIIELLNTVPPGVQTTAALRSALQSDDQREALQKILAACDEADVSPGAVDHVAIVRRLQQSGFLPVSGELLPVLDQVTFSSSEQLRQKLARFSVDIDLCSEIARSQRRTIEKRY
ncbi:MAG: hypothetical protein H7144_09705, partial [Burkholderiales bacterium]|nr:hypothetical protein [Phycisphaerae bacterium]